MAKYTLESIRSLADNSEDGSIRLEEDDSMEQWCLTVKLEPTAYWFLSVFVGYSGKPEGFSLDYEAADDSHYEFKDEKSIRKLLYKDGDEDLYLHQILLRFMNKHRGNGNKLLELIRPYVTEEFHFASFGD